MYNVLEYLALFTTSCFASLLKVACLSSTQRCEDGVSLAYHKWEIKISVSEVVQISLFPRQHLSGIWISMSWVTELVL